MTAVAVEGEALTHKTLNHPTILCVDREKDNMGDLWFVLEI